MTGPRFQQPKPVILARLIQTLEELETGEFTSNDPEGTRERLRERIAKLEAQGVTPAAPLARRVITGTQ